MNSQNRQLSIIHQLKVLSRGCLSARQTSIALINSALRYQMLTGRMDNKETADRTGEGGRGDD